MAKPGASFIYSFISCYTLHITIEPYQFSLFLSKFLEVCAELPRIHSSSFSPFDAPLIFLSCLFFFLIKCCRPVGRILQLTRCLYLYQRHVNIHYIDLHEWLQHYTGLFDGIPPVRALVRQFVLYNTLQRLLPNLGSLYA